MPGRTYTEPTQQGHPRKNVLTNTRTTPAAPINGPEKKTASRHTTFLRHKYVSLPAVSSRHAHTPKPTCKFPSIEVMIRTLQRLKCFTCLYAPCIGSQRKRYEFVGEEGRGCRLTVPYSAHYLMLVLLGPTLPPRRPGGPKMKIIVDLVMDVFFRLPLPGMLPHDWYLFYLVRVMLLT